MKRGPECWFCLSNPDIEKHLIASIGDDIYLTLAKGGLNDFHCLIIPLGHYPSLNYMLQTVSESDEDYEAVNNTFTEFEDAKQNISAVFEKMDHHVVYFESFAGLLEGGQSKNTMHTHIQV